MTSIWEHIDTIGTNHTPCNPGVGAWFVASGLQLGYPTPLKVLTDNERAGRLRSEIAQLEARYDGVFPPGVYSILEKLRQELVALSKAL